jgi:fructokinase
MTEQRPHSTGTVLVIGEALTDIVTTMTGTQEHPGGSPANVALGLARLGVQTTLLTALGADARGQAIAERLNTAGVHILPESWSLPATSTATAEVEPDGSARYTFDIVWDLPRHIPLPAARHVHIGSIAAFLAPGADQAEKIIRVLAPTATVSFDPNIRPALIGDPTAARARFERLAALADVIKLSDEDAAFLYPDHLPDQAASAITALSPTVALTKGVNGSTLFADGRVIEVAPVRTSVVDTIGAGDSYMAALLWALLDGARPSAEPSDQSDLAAAGRFAAQAAAITVSRAGAQPPTVTELLSGAL